MLGKLRSTLAQLPRGLLLWVGLSLLFGIGFIVTLGDLSSLSASETRRANMAHQRVIVDPHTGVVAGLSGSKPVEEEAFDVGGEEKEADTEAAAGHEEEEKEEAAQEPAPAEHAEADVA